MWSSPRSTATISPTAAPRISRETIAAIRAGAPGTTIEVLTPDFLRKDGALEIVIAARPDVFNHNMETVPSLYRRIRPGADYRHSLALLKDAKRLDPRVFTKSGIMVGLGETADEVLGADGRSHEAPVSISSPSANISSRPASMRPSTASSRRTSSTIL